ncbi:MAG TPA: hypothetical protein ENH01_00385 [Nitrospirae bacterium]|nr:hypothetical protein [Nitrospirota bacterium]
MTVPEIIQVADRALIWNKNTDEWEEGWVNIFRRMKEVTFMTGVTVSAPNGSVHSGKADYRAYSAAMILVKMGNVDPTTGIYVAVETSMNGATWYQEYAENGSFYGLRFDGNQSNQNFSFKTESKGHFIRIRAYQIGSGTSTTLSVYGILM